jgi:hypothetical protein
MAAHVIKSSRAVAILALLFQVSPDLKSFARARRGLFFIPGLVC